MFNIIMILKIMWSILQNEFLFLVLLNLWLIQMH